MASGYNMLTTEIEAAPNYGATQSKASSSQNATTTEFFQYCDRITTNLFTINKAGTTLERSLKLIETSNDNKVLRERITQVNTDASASVQDTTALLRSAHQITQGDKMRTVRIQRLQTEFQASATRLAEIQKKTVKIVRKARLPADMVAAEPLEQDSSSEQLIEHGEQELQRKKQIQAMELEMAMEQEREQRVLQLEGDIVNINDIMRELSSMVADQGEVVSSIEDNVITAHDYVEEGRVELIKASAYQDKFRKRVCTLLIILLIVFIIIGIILGLHFTNNT